MKSSLNTTFISAVTLVLTSLASFAAQPSSQCMNVAYSGSGPLGVFPVNGVPMFGFPPQAAMIGNLPVLVSSFITSPLPPVGQGANGQGATHFTLQHRYESTDAARPGYFITEDRAVCAPAGSDPAVCRVNDVLTIVYGEGIFANAGGSAPRPRHDLLRFYPTVSVRLPHLQRSGARLRQRSILALRLNADAAP